MLQTLCKMFMIIWLGMSLYRLVSSPIWELLLLDSGKNALKTGANYARWEVFSTDLFYQVLGNYIFRLKLSTPGRYKRHTLIMLCILIFFLIQRVQGFEFDQSYATPCKVLTIGKEAAVLGADQVSCNQMRWQKEWAERWAHQSPDALLLYNQMVSLYFITEMWCHPPVCSNAR